MKVTFSKPCLKAFRKMPVEDAIQLAMKLGRYAESVDANIDVKTLQGTENVFRLRHGDYRAVFEICGDELQVKRIGHRKDVYER